MREEVINGGDERQILPDRIHRLFQFGPGSYTIRLRFGSMKGERGWVEIPVDYFGGRLQNLVP
jgi:hypothetical protein